MYCHAVPYRDWALISSQGYARTTGLCRFTVSRIIYQRFFFVHWNRFCVPIIAASRLQESEKQLLVTEYPTFLLLPTKKEKGHPSTAKMDSFFAFPLCLLPVSSGSRVKGGKQCEGCVNPLVAGESFTQLLRHNFALRSQ